MSKPRVDLSDIEGAPHRCGNCGATVYVVTRPTSDPRDFCSEQHHRLNRDGRQHALTCGPLRAVAGGRKDEPAPPSPRRGAS